MEMAMFTWKQACFAPMILVAALGQTPSMPVHGSGIKVLLVNGKNGKPMKHERLLVFFQSGQSHTLESDNNGTDPHTDDSGYAVIPLPPSHLPYVQVWVDYRTLCQEDPNSRAFSVTQIVSDGASTPNNCGKANHPSSPGTLVVYARPSTLKEQMAR
jgi:hypothetical protein